MKCTKVVQIAQKDFLTRAIFKYMETNWTRCYI